MAEMVRVRNVSDREIVVGWWYVLPGETAKVSAAEAERLLADRAFAPVVAEAAEPVARSSGRKRSR